jgi:hypothetical protein
MRSMPDAPPTHDAPRAQQEILRELRAARHARGEAEAAVVLANADVRATLQAYEDAFNQVLALERELDASIADGCF